MIIQSLVAIGRSFVEVFDHSQVMKDQGGSDKKPQYQGSFSGSRSSS